MADCCWWRWQRLCKGSQESVRITAQRMVSIARLLLDQQAHRFAFIHKGANIALRLGQGKGAFQRFEGLGASTLRLKRKGLQQQDLHGAAHSAAAFGRLQETHQQPGGLVKRSSFPIAFAGAMRTRANVMWSNSRGS